MGEPSAETAERERRGDKEIYFIAHTSKTHTHTHRKERESLSSSKPEAAQLGLVIRKRLFSSFQAFPPNAESVLRLSPAESGCITMLNS